MLNKRGKKISLGRDPTCGRVSFRTGRILSLKDKLRNRSSKVARKEVKRNEWI